MKKSMLALMFLMPWATWAGKEAGNGGDVVICPNSIEVLDIYEARTLHGIVYNWPVAGAPEQMVEAALLPLKQASPHRYERMVQWTRDFMREATFPPGIKLEDISDSQQVFLPVGCKIEQVAVQKEPKFTGEPRYIISGDLWNRLDPSNRAALVLHEISYREAIEEKQVNSISARYFGSLLASQRIAGISAIEFRKLASELGFERISVRDAEVAQSSAKFYPNGNLERAGEGKIQIEGNKLEFSSIYLYENGNVREIYKFYGLSKVVTFNGVTFQPGSELEFYPNGKLKKADLRMFDPQQITGKDFVISTSGLWEDKDLDGARFDDKGRLTSVSGREGEFTVQGKKIKLLSQNGEADTTRMSDDGTREYDVTIGVDHVVFTFHPETGVPTAGYLVEPTSLRFAGRTLELTGSVQFFPNGEVKSGKVAETRLPFYGAERRIQGLVEVTEQGRIIKGELLDEMQIKIQGKTVRFKGETSLYPTGELNGITLLENVKLKNSYGSKMERKAGEKLYLEKSGTPR